MTYQEKQGINVLPPRFTWIYFGNLVFFGGEEGLSILQKKFLSNNKRLEKNRTREAMERIIEQVLSAIQVLCLI